MCKNYNLDKIKTATKKLKELSKGFNTKKDIAKFFKKLYDLRRNINTLIEEKEKKKDKVSDLEKIVVTLGSILLENKEFVKWLNDKDNYENK